MSQAWHPLISQPPSNKDEMRWKTMKLKVSWGNWMKVAIFRCFFEAKLIQFEVSIGNNRLGILQKIWMLYSSYRLDSLETWHVVDIVWMFPSVLQGLVTVPFWEYWTSPYSSHGIDHIPFMVGWCEKWGHLMTHVLLSHKSYQPFCMNPASWFTLIYPVCSSVNSPSAYVNYIIHQRFGSHSPWLIIPLLRHTQMS